MQAATRPPNSHSVLGSVPLVRRLIGPVWKSAIAAEGRGASGRARGACRKAIRFVDTPRMRRCPICCWHRACLQYLDISTDRMLGTDEANPRATYSSTRSPRAPTTSWSRSAESASIRVPYRMRTNPRSRPIGRSSFTVIHEVGTIPVAQFQPHLRHPSMARSSESMVICSGTEVSPGCRDRNDQGPIGKIDDVQRQRFLQRRGFGRH